MITCPISSFSAKHINLSHGGGGSSSDQLIKNFILPRLEGVSQHSAHDAAYITDISQMVFTTDSHVVDPIFFPGGDIGRLSVYGTVNDLSVSGADARYLSLSLIIEEGFALEHLAKILDSIREASIESGVVINTGDTKVIPRGKMDGLFINTSGVGQLIAGGKHPNHINEGDSVVIFGDLGRHSISILAKRYELEFSNEIKSDCRSLKRPIVQLLQSQCHVSCMRDLTRGGLSAALLEISSLSDKRIEIAESKLPVTEGVRAACELLGFDVMQLANEGCFILFTQTPQLAEQILGEHSDYVVNIGRVTSGAAGASLINGMGFSREIESYGGELLPRIC